LILLKLTNKVYIVYLNILEYQ